MRNPTACWAIGHRPSSSTARPLRRTHSVKRATAPHASSPFPSKAPRICSPISRDEMQRATPQCAASCTQNGGGWSATQRSEWHSVTESRCRSVASSRLPLGRRGRRRWSRPLGRLALLQPIRSEEHTSELQSRGHLVCRLLLEKKKKFTTSIVKSCRGVLVSPLQAYTASVLAQ